LPHPRCRNCGRVPQGWGCYERTDVRDGDGFRFKPLPIRRFYCRKCKRTFSVLPAFLCRYLHYLGDVVGRAFTDWLAGRPIEEIPLQMDGPALLTVRRWLTRLMSLQVQAWLEQRAQALQRAPSLEIKHPAHRVWILAQSITKTANSLAKPAALIQWANLRHLLRYGSSTYSQI